jgi:threonine/homoserine/homoserine lactone efflux protein
VSSLVIRGFLLGFAIAASPGPIFFLCLRRSLVRGRLIGLVSGLGVATADGFYAALAAFGIGAITTVLFGERRWLALAGGVVLVVLGVRTLLERASTSREAAATNGAGFAWAYLSTLGLTITNPATIISFAALAAALGIGISAGLIAPSLLVLGVFAGSASWWLILALVAAALGSRVTPRVVRGISFVSGIAIALLGLIAVVTALI